MKYIHVARDGRDAFLSWHNHERGFTPEARMKVGAIIMSDPVLAPMLAGGPPPAIPEDPQVYFQTWIAHAEEEPRTGPGVDLPTSISRTPTGASGAARTCCSCTITT